MAQFLIQLPKEASFEIEGLYTSIKDHRVVNGNLCDMIMHMVKLPYSDRQTLYKLEKHGITFEAAIECCVTEMENIVWVLVNAIGWDYTYWENERDTLKNFSESAAGRTMAGQYVDKIRSCSSWDELHDEFNQKSKFQQEIIKKIRMEVM